ncbi:hypothetical protein [Candidatus Alkanophaga liquidiphilum]
MARLRVYPVRGSVLRPNTSLRLWAGCPQGIRVERLKVKLPPSVVE